MWIKMRNILQQVFTDTESPRAEYYTLVDRERNDWHMKFPVKAPNSVLERDVIFKIFHIFLEPGWLKVRLHNQGSAWSPSSLVWVYSILEIRSRASPLYQLKFIHRQKGTFRPANLMVKTVVENTQIERWDYSTGVHLMVQGRKHSWEEAERTVSKDTEMRQFRSRRRAVTRVGESTHGHVCRELVPVWLTVTMEGHGGAVVLRRTGERESRSRYVYIQKETYLNKLALMIMRPSVFKIW